MGGLALKLIEQFNHEELKAKTRFSVSCFIQHRKAHLRETLPPLQNSFKEGLESGDLECAAVSALMHSRYAYLAGRQLASVEDEMSEVDKTISRLKFQSPLQAHRMTRQAVLNLMGRGDAPHWLGGVAYNEEEMVPVHREQGDARAMLLYPFQ